MAVKPAQFLAAVVRVSLALINSEARRNVARKGLLISQLMVCQEGGTGHWLAPCGFLRLLSYIAQDHIRGVGTHNSQLGPPTSIPDQGNAS